MDDNYLNKTLPRWQFLKEYLIEQTEDFRKEFDEELFWVFNDFTEVIEKIKKVENAKSLEKISKNIGKDLKKIKKKWDLDEESFEGVYWRDVTNCFKLHAWLNITRLYEMINRKK